MKLLVYCCLIFVFIACTDKKPEIERAMAKYDEYILNLQTDSIVNSYLPDGVLGGEGMDQYAGRDSIKKYLQQFDPSWVKVITNKSTTSSIVFSGDTAVQQGTFHQVVAIKEDTSVHNGIFIAKWLLNEKKKWLLASMYTKTK